MKNGSIQLNDIIGKKPILAKWSTFETTEKLTSKDSGKYHVVVIDANNCMKDSTFYIPNISKGTGSISLASLDYISAYPNLFQNQLTIDNPRIITIERISIYNLIGKLVYTKNIFEKKEQIDLSLNLLTKGNYLFSIETNQGIKNFKISK